MNCGLQVCIQVLTVCTIQNSLHACTCTDHSALSSTTLDTQSYREKWLTVTASSLRLPHTHNLGNQKMESSPRSTWKIQPAEDSVHSLLVRSGAGKEMGSRVLDIIRLSSNLRLVRKEVGRIYTCNINDTVCT